jgi:hypothetical protein
MAQRRRRPLCTAGLSVRGSCFILQVFIAAKGIDDLDTCEVALVIGDHHTVIGGGDRGDDHVQRATGRPAIFPSAISFAQANPACSPNERIRPAKSACGPSGLLNHVSRASRLRPAGLKRMPRRISATVNDAMKRSSSARASNHARRADGGSGLMTLLMIVMSSRYRVTDQDGRKKLAAPFVLVLPYSTIIGYYTLSSTAVNLAELPAQTVRKLPRYDARRRRIWMTCQSFSTSASAKRASGSLDKVSIRLCDSKRCQTTRSRFIRTSP